MRLSEVVAKHGDQFVPVVEAELKSLASEKPDFVYKDKGVAGSCRYNSPAMDGDKVVGNECTGCIFGQALQNLGWSDQTELGYICPIQSLLRDTAGILTPSRWREVQAEQDSGSTWSHAVSYL